MSRRDKMAWRPVCQGALLHVGRAGTESGTPGDGGEPSEEPECVEEPSRVMSAIANTLLLTALISAVFTLNATHVIRHSICYKTPRSSCFARTTPTYMVPRKFQCKCTTATVCCARSSYLRRCSRRLKKQGKSRCWP
jgi:hypothetical protein